MGLDNYPRPYPCEVLGYAVYTNDGKINCDEVPCPFKNIGHVIGILGTWCWIRGGYYNHIVEEATNGEYSLYADLTLDDLKKVLDAVKVYCMAEHGDFNDCAELIRYLETLISEVEKFPEDTRKEFRLVAWW